MGIIQPTDYVQEKLNEAIVVMNKSLQVCPSSPAQPQLQQDM